MKFRVIGSNRDTGARMTLEFDADSKAAAERKAAQAGMSVNRVEPAPGNDTPAGGAAFVPKRQQSHAVRWIALLIIVVTIVWWMWRNGRLHVHF